MRLLLNLVSCNFCPSAILAHKDEDAGLLLLWHMADAHPERFGTDRVRRAYERMARERRN